MDMPSGEQLIERSRVAARPGPKGLPLALFFREFCKHPMMIGSIIPSSDRLIARMLAPIDWQAARLVVEYGPGTGSFTRAILERLAPDARLVAIDTNPSFAAYLRRAIADPRLIVVHGSAIDVAALLAARGLGQADYIVSGLPFSTLPPGVGPAILRETHGALRPGGAFVVYQYALKVLQLMQPWFDRIDRDFEPINIPPAQIFWAWKAAAAPSASASPN